MMREKFDVRNRPVFFSATVDRKGPEEKEALTAAHV